MAENLIDPKDVEVKVEERGDGTKVIYITPKTGSFDNWLDWPLIEHFRNLHFRGVLWTKVKWTIQDGKLLYYGPVPTESSKA